MKPIASPLDIIDFAILNFEFNFIQPGIKSDVDVRTYFSEYSLDIDFGIQSNEIIRVFIKAEINRDKEKLPGYSILAEAVCIFEFNKKIELAEAAKKSVEGFSTIYIALNALRGFISQLTASAPLGRYILPSVDLNDLIAQKKKDLLRKTITKKETAGKKSKKKQ